YSGSVPIERAPRFRLPLLHELRAQHEALDALEPTVDLLRVAGQADRLDDGADLQRLPRALHLQVLDERDAVAVREQVSTCIPDLDDGPRRRLGGADPLAAVYIVYIVVVGHRPLLLLSRTHKARTAADASDQPFT